MLSLTCLIMPIYNIITQTIFVVLFTSRSLPTWGKPLDAVSSVSPRYLYTTYSQLTTSPFFYRHHMMTDYTLPHCGEPYHLSHTAAILHIIYNPTEAVPLTRLKGLGEKQKVHHDIAFLLVLDEGEATGDSRYGLLTIWLNPCQARVCSMEEAVRQLTAWVSSGPNWPYALVQLNEDTCHVPLPKEGHQGVLPQGGADMTACRRISQLEVCQLLVSGLQVTYPVGLNGHEDLIITSLPKSLANGISLTGGKSVYLEIDILQPMAKNQTGRHRPLLDALLSLYPAALRPLPQSWKERSAWPWR